MSDKKHCGNCAYNGLLSDKCYFPNPQDGGEPPLMAIAAMPNEEFYGENCYQWRKHENR